jgi:hypothetical protein
MKLLFVTLIVSFGVNAAFAQSTTSTSNLSKTDAGTLTAPTSIVDSIQKPTKWSASAFYGMYQSVRSINDGIYDGVQNSKGEFRGNNSGIAADAYVQVRRDIGNGQKLALRVSGMQNQTDFRRNDEWSLWDPQILYSFPVFASTLRLSFPVSEWSQDIGRWELRYNGGNDILQAGKFTLSSLVEARAYAYTVEEDGQRSYRARAGGSANYEISQYFEPYFSALYEWNGFYHGLGQNIEGEMVDRQELLEITHLYLGAVINPIPKFLSINAYIEDARARSRGVDKNLFDEEHSIYNLEFSISM